MINLFLFRVTHIRRASSRYRRAMARLAQLDLLELGFAITFGLFVLALVSTAGGGR